MKSIPFEEVKSVGAWKPSVSQRKAGIEEKNDHKQLEKTCLKMLNYLAKENSHTIREVDHLIVDMHRSVICMQRKKRKMVEKR